MQVALDLCDEELTLFKENYEEINTLQLKILKLYTAKRHDPSKIRQFRQQIDQAEGEIVEVLARTKMQNCLRKIDSCDDSSRAVDVFLRLSLDLVKKQVKHCQEVQIKCDVEASGISERQIGHYEKKKTEIEIVLYDGNHPKRKDYLFKIVWNIARNVAQLNANHSIDDNELKVALCIFEIQCDKLDDWKYRIEKLKISKLRERRESIEYKNIKDEISSLETNGETYRKSIEFRSCLRTIRRLTYGKCTHVVDVRLRMLIQLKYAIDSMIEEEIYKLSFITVLSVNKDEPVTDYEQFQLEAYEEINYFQDMLAGNDNEGRSVFNDKIFHQVKKLNYEEIELLDKVLYNEEIHEKNCPVCFNEHTDGELLVSLRCPCKKERLCQICAFNVLKEKSQCPCCRTYV